MNATSAQTVECYTCGGRARLVRSVRLRHNAGPEFDRIIDRWPDWNAIPQDDRDAFGRALLQYERNSKHRRAFICERCYKFLDNDFGVNEIMTPHGPTSFGLSGECRAGRAAVYDYERWRRYQARLAAKMGVSSGE